MLRIIYIDRVVLYIYEKRVEDLMIWNIMAHITKSLYFISFTLYKVEEYGHSLLVMDLDGYVCKDIYIYRTIYLQDKVKKGV